MGDYEELRASLGKDKWGEKPLFGPSADELNRLVAEILDDIPLGSDKSRIADTYDNRLARKRLKMQLEDIATRGLIASPIN